MTRRRVGLREHRVEVRDPCVRDEALRAVEDVLVAVAPRLRAHRCGIRAGAGLGQRVGGDPLSARDLGQETVLLLLGARKPQRERAQLLHGEDEPHRRIGLGDLLHGDEQHQRPRIRPSVALVEGEPEDLVLAQELDHVPREVARLVDLGRAGSDSLTRQGADELADLTLFLGKRVPRHTSILGAVGVFEPRVQVVVVIPQDLHDPRRAGEPRVRADEDRPRRPRRRSGRRDPGRAGARSGPRRAAAARAGPAAGSRRRRRARSGGTRGVARRGLPAGG